MKDLSMEFLSYLSCFLCQCVFSFVSSYYANGITLRGLGVGDVIYDGNWIDASLKNQRTVPLIIQRSKQPFYLQGLGLFNISLEVYLAVIDFLIILLRKLFTIFTVNFQLIKTSVSYYMIFREFSM